jgi:hypothetical protein
LNARNPVLVRVRLLVLSTLHERANEKPLPPLPDTPKVREMLALLREREQRRDQIIARVCALLHVAIANPLELPPLDLLDPFDVDRRADIRIGEVGEARGPPRRQAAPKGEAAL